MYPSSLLFAAALNGGHSSATIVMVSAWQVMAIANINMKAQQYFMSRPRKRRVIAAS
jgi:hypothetical protein